jgi:hypothetical protein
MPNGRSGDNPLTDMLVHGRHPFPRDMERMLRQLHAAQALNRVPPYAPFSWAKSQELAEGRQLLRGLLADLGIEAPRRPWWKFW